MSFFPNAKTVDPSPEDMDDVPDELLDGPISLPAISTPIPTPAPSQPSPTSNATEANDTVDCMIEPVEIAVGQASIARSLFDLQRPYIAQLSNEIGGGVGRFMLEGTDQRSDSLLEAVDKVFTSTSESIGNILDLETNVVYTPSNKGLNRTSTVFSRKVDQELEVIGPFKSLKSLEIKTESASSFAIYGLQDDGVELVIASFADPFSTLTYAQQLAEIEPNVTTLELIVSDEFTKALELDQQFIKAKSHKYLDELVANPTNSDQLNELISFAGKSPQHAHEAWLAWQEKAPESLRKNAAPLPLVVAALEAAAKGLTTREEVAQSFANQIQSWSGQFERCDGARIAFINKTQISRGDKIETLISDVQMKISYNALEKRGLDALWKSITGTEPPANGYPKKEPSPTPVPTQAAQTPKHDNLSSNVKAVLLPAAAVLTAEKLRDTTVFRYPHGKPAYTDLNTSVQVHADRDLTVIVAAIEKAKEKGWVSIKVSGNNDFVKAATEIAECYGIKVTSLDKKAQASHAPSM